MVLHATPTILQCCETNGSNIVASRSYANLMKTINDNGGGDLVIVKITPHDVHMFMYTDTLRPYLKTSLILTLRSHDVNFCIIQCTTEISDQATKEKKKGEKEKRNKIYHRNLRPSNKVKKKNEKNIPQKSSTKR